LAVSEMPQDMAQDYSLLQSRFLRAVRNPLSEV
jgi:hypothetical protein